MAKSEESKHSSSDEFLAPAQKDDEILFLDKLNEDSVSEKSSPLFKHHSKIKSMVLDTDENCIFG